jgi:TonB family protein
MLFVLAAALMQVAAPPAKELAPLPKGVTNADWLRKPSGAEVTSAFPSEAARMGIEGIVVILCRVSVEGAAVDCAIEREEPLGYGFGQAALRFSTKFKLRPQTKQGVPDGGGIMRIPIDFFMPQAKTFPVTATYPGLTGHAEVHCRVSAQRRLEHCLVGDIQHPLLADLALKVAVQVAVPATAPIGLRIVVPVEITPPKTSEQP